MTTTCTVRTVGVSGSEPSPVVLRGATSLGQLPAFRAGTACRSVALIADGAVVSSGYGERVRAALEADIDIDIDIETRPVRGVRRTSGRADRGLGRRLRRGARAPRRAARRRARWRLGAGHREAGGGAAGRSLERRHRPLPAGPRGSARPPAARRHPHHVRHRGRGHPHVRAGRRSTGRGRPEGVDVGRCAPPGPDRPRSRGDGHDAARRHDRHGARRLRPRRRSRDRAATGRTVARARAAGGGAGPRPPAPGCRRRERSSGAGGDAGGGLPRRDGDRRLRDRHGPRHRARARHLLPRPPRRGRRHRAGGRPGWNVEGSGRHSGGGRGARRRRRRAGVVLPLCGRAVGSSRGGVLSDVNLDAAAIARRW